MNGNRPKGLIGQGGKKKQTRKRREGFLHAFLQRLINFTRRSASCSGTGVKGTWGILAPIMHTGPMR
jgi:hypothetical protein